MVLYSSFSMWVFPERGMLSQINELLRGQRLKRVMCCCITIAVVTVFCQSSPHISIWLSPLTQCNLDIIVREFYPLVWNIFLPQVFILTPLTWHNPSWPYLHYGYKPRCKPHRLFFQLLINTANPIFSAFCIWRYVNIVGTSKASSVSAHPSCRPRAGPLGSVPKAHLLEMWTRGRRCAAAH